MATYVSNRNGGETDEQGHYRFQTKVWNGNIQNGFAVHQNSPLALSVIVPAGDLKIDYGEYAFTAWNDSDVVVALSTADATNPRIDRIVAYIDLGEPLGTTNNPGVLKFIAVAGTPAGSPTKASDATVQAAVGALNPWCELSTVRVEAAATTIPNSKITDTRVLVTVGDGTVGTAAIKDLAVTDDKINDVAAGKMVADVAFSVYRSAAQSVGAASTAIVNFEVAEYDKSAAVDLVTHKGRVTAAADCKLHIDTAVGLTMPGGSTYHVDIYKNGTLYKSLTRFIQGAGTDAGVMVGGCDVPLAAGDYIEVAITNTTGATKAISVGSGSAWLTGHQIDNVKY